jgi:hypothetical protein
VKSTNAQIAIDQPVHNIGYWDLVIGHSYSFVVSVVSSW